MPKDGPALRVAEGLLRRELEELARDDRIAHAFALYDMEHFPEKVRFVSLRRDGRPVAYLLIWYGDPSKPVVHWAGGTESLPLSMALPKPPFVALVPPEVIAGVSWPPPGRSFPLELWARSQRGAPTDKVTSSKGDPTTRRLMAKDRPLLHRFAARHRADPPLAALGEADLERVRLYGTIVEREGLSTLVAVARTLAELPEVWIVGGVYTEPEERGRGHGRRVTGGLADEAHLSGADCALYVRADNQPALSVYRSLGFRRIAVRQWVDAGGGPPP